MKEVYEFFFLRFALTFLVGQSCLILPNYGLVPNHDLAPRMSGISSLNLLIFSYYIDMLHESFPYVHKRFHLGANL